MERRIWAFWTTGNPMSENRLRGLESMRENFGVPVEFLDPAGIEAAAKAVGVPLHPAYRFLSGNHKSDYLRCYFLHHVGGGYADVKVYSKDNNWAETFDAMERDPKIWLAGRAEVAGGSPFANWNRTVPLARLVSCGWLVARGRTPFSHAWWTEANRILDRALPELERHPAQSPRDKDEERTGYPLRWADLMGRPFHRLCFELSPQHKSRTLRPGYVEEDYL